MKKILLLFALLIYANSAICQASGNYTKPGVVSIDWEITKPDEITLKISGAFDNGFSGSLRMSGFYGYTTVFSASEITPAMYGTTITKKLSSLYTNALYTFRSSLVSNTNPTYDNFSNVIEIPMGYYTPPIATFEAITQPTAADGTGSFAIVNYDSRVTYEISPSVDGALNVANGVFTVPPGTYTVTASYNHYTNGSSAPVTISYNTPSTEPTNNSPTTPSIPTAPNNLRVLYNCANGITIGWDAPTQTDGIEAYYLMFSPDNTNYFQVGSTGPWGRQLNMYELSQYHGHVVYFKVIALSNQSTQTAWSSAIPVVWKGYQAPNDPINVHSVKTEKTSNSLTLAWQKPSQDYDCRSNIIMTTYVFYKLASETDFNNAPIILNADATTAKISGLNPGDVVDYRVMYLSDRYIQSNRVPNNIIMGRDTTLALPTVAKFMAVPQADSLGNAAFMLTWPKADATVKSFTLNVSKVDTLHYGLVTTLSDSLIRYFHTNVEEGVVYNYSLLSVQDSLGNGSLAKADPVIFDYTKAPEAPAQLTAKFQSNGVALAWTDKSLREQNFVLERSADSTNFTLLDTLNRNTVSFVDSAALASGTYYYRIKAINPKGASAYSNIAKATSTTGYVSDAEILTIYPNPTFEKIAIKIPENLKGKYFTVMINTESNKTVYRRNFKTNEDEISIANLPSGALLLSITSEDYNISKKVVKY